ncbi:MAG: hypothetical protein F2734_02400 [Actinobacteria bacterium]|uniref:Unannotated protein n=2 Tax=freshwater metagenome TaxID=449393 RepID=A0A6J7MIB9_9ZZZZ|nr:copper resistance protein CopC [Actinomycetota bacterium]MSV63002.1 hypothetical protein [Actinomycetota bacterium]MSX44615.1 hypothetical protein [Actinomycetota bacterium]MSX85290.1 hypothetical protein [Actinomycetota bacterium]MSY23740.1 hypothetical protein [Actinomycetota bacterium]
MQKSRISMISFLLTIFAIVSGPTSFGHTSLVSSTPAAGSVISEWPTEVKLEFAEELQTFSAGEANFIEVLDISGARVNATVATVSGATITSETLKANKFGIVTVNYRVVAQDGHVLEGSYNFTFDPSRDAAVSPAPTTSNEASSYPYRGVAAVFIIATLIFGIIVYRKNSKEN